MFVLLDAHIDFIRDDLRSRGIENEALLEDIVDHVCCLLETSLQDESEFHNMYHQIIANFYGKSIVDIEKETQLLIQFKNYYAMKKTMLYSGAFASIALVAGLVLKFTHSPGAAALILSGIFIFGFLFLPLMVLLKSREEAPLRDKILTFVGSLCVLLFSLGTLFKIMYWPYANMLGVSAMVSVAFVYIPLLFFTGLRKPETRTSAMVTTIVLITGIGLVLTLVRSPHATQKMELQKTASYLHDEELLAKMQSRLTNEKITSPEILHIDSLCVALKREVIHMETNRYELPAAVLDGSAPISDSNMQKILRETESLRSSYLALKDAVQAYNSAAVKRDQLELPMALFMDGEMRTTDVLSALSSIRLALLLNLAPTKNP